MSPTTHVRYRHGRPLESAGASAVVLASNENTRPRSVEVLADDDRYTIVRRRETLDDPEAGETTA